MKRCLYMLHNAMQDTTLLRVTGTVSVDSKVLKLTSNVSKVFTSTLVRRHSTERRLTGRQSLI